MCNPFSFDFWAPAWRYSWPLAVVRIGCIAMTSAARPWLWLPQKSRLLTERTKTLSLTCRPLQKPSMTEWRRRNPPKLHVIA